MAKVQQEDKFCTLAANFLLQPFHQTQRENLVTQPSQGNREIPGKRSENQLEVLVLTVFGECCC